LSAVTRQPRLLAVYLISIIMAQKDAFKVTAVTAKANEHSTNLEKDYGTREEEHVVFWET
jgi:hypothetical protein